MKIDYHRCIMEQIDTEGRTPDEVAEIIFEAKDKRMEDFSDNVDGIYTPLEGVTAKERAYLLQHEDSISRRLQPMTMQEHYAEMVARTKALLNAKMAELKAAQRKKIAVI